MIRESFLPTTGTAAILRRVFSFPVFLGALLVVGIFFGARTSIKDPDTWWHLKVGEQVLREGTLPTGDPYSFTVPGNHWIAYEWLGEVAMAGVERLGGLPALIGLLMALSGTLMVLIYYYSYLRSGNVKAAFVASALMLPAAAVSFNLRPQLFGYIIFLLTLISLEKFRQGQKKTLWLLPALFLLWGNIHGSFVFGMFALGLYWVAGWKEFRWGGLQAEPWSDGQRRHLGLVFLLSLVALTVTPYGTAVAAYPLEMAFFQPLNINNIQEWQPLNISFLAGKICLGFLLFFLLIQVLSHQMRYRVEELGLLLFSVYASWQHIRFVIIFALIFTPFLAALLARWFSAYRAEKDPHWLNAALMGVIVTLGMVFFPSSSELKGEVAKKFPARAVEYLRQNPAPGPVLNEYGWGGYLIWSLSPEHKVFIDGRADIYEYGGVLGDYLQIMSLHGDTLILLRKYNIRACLISNEAPLGTLLAALPEWGKAYSDDMSVLYVRRAGYPGVTDRAHNLGGPIPPAHLTAQILPAPKGPAAASGALRQ
ncbi:MAG: hypothetical protein O6850_02850 [Acidobacteria bacterium]|nr:hypothetical protein [Acidobacteriota bacterium]